MSWLQLYYVMVTAVLCHGYSCILYCYVEWWFVEDGMGKRGWAPGNYFLPAISRSSLIHPRVDEETFGEEYGKKHEHVHFSG